MFDDWRTRLKSRLSHVAYAVASFLFPWLKHLGWNSAVMSRPMKTWNGLQDSGVVTQNAETLKSLSHSSLYHQSKCKVWKWRKLVTSCYHSTITVLHSPQSNVLEDCKINFVTELFGLSNLSKKWGFRRVMELKKDKIVGLICWRM